MMTLRPLAVLSLLACFSPALVCAQPAATAPAITIPNTVSAINSPTPMSQRVVHYEIDAKYDPKTHQLEGAETLTYHNLTGQPLDTFPFHLYLNAFQPKATWIRETKRDGTRDTSFEKWEDKNYGSDEIKGFEVVGQGDLTPMTTIKTTRRSSKSNCPKRFRRMGMFNSKSNFTTSFLKRSSARVTNGIFCSPDNGSRRLACGFMGDGIAINSTVQRNSSLISASMT
jgi:hypothetical protein